MHGLDWRGQNVLEYIGTINIVAVGNAQPLALRLRLYQSKRFVGSRVACITHRKLKQKRRNENVNQK